MKIFNLKYKKLTLAATTIAFSMLLSAFISHQEQEKAAAKFTNLKVLPKNTSPDELKNVMREFNVSLGVKCGYCHAASKEDPKKMDFASDENKNKDAARAMMKMTAKINKKYFHHSTKQGDIKSITCKTCHNGKQEPEMKIAAL